MYHIKIICIGKLKEQYWRDAEKEYVKRLGAYAKFSVHEIPEEPFRSSAERIQVLAKEGGKMIKIIPKDAYCIALEIKGKSFSSESFAELIQGHGECGGMIVFCIGGALGLSDEVLERANTRCSFSALTFPHQLVRIVVLEQVYRAMTIVHGKQYHY
ncbi:23S rRNA (pseudouridine(1915)-N(3))-methyltransferase RlmH [Candidatus Uhrbacteria bacterium]|nr:23S rRNA (pseudouridine(1915)-N(3))-methyltransferase RlmH [Candidatus Uhrbacteria bacterium]